MNLTKKMILTFLSVLILFVVHISSLPTSKEPVKSVFKRQASEIDNSDIEDNNDDDLNKRLLSIADTGSKIIENLISTLSSSAKIIGDLVEAKIRIAEPLLENTGKILDTLNDTKTIERSLETVQGIAEASIKTSIGISTALSRSSQNPLLSQGFGVLNDVTARIIRLGICNIVCPLQKGTKDDGEGCKEQFCEENGSFDKLDDYEGDFVDASNNDV